MPRRGYRFVEAAEADSAPRALRPSVQYRVRAGAFALIAIVLLALASSGAFDGVALATLAGGEPRGAAAAGY